MPPTKTEALLTEIRDLLKEQHDTMLKTHRMQTTATVVKVIFYAGIVIFSMYGAYFYASTIVSMTNQIH